MKLLLGLWGHVTTAATIYMLYKQFETVAKAKDTLYHDLDPEQKLLYEKVFGKPGEQIQNPLIPGLNVRADLPSQIKQVITGT